MNITEIAEYVWNHSQTIDFGSTSEWPPNLFTKSWAKRKPFEDIWNRSASGWYWFLVNMTYDEMHKITKPPSLPQSGCDMGLMAHKNSGVFKDVLLCAADGSGFRVVYNGHEKNITARIRSHFALDNDRTGALGIRHYPLSKRRWRVKLFLSPLFADIEPADKSQIEMLMNEPTGRCAVESAWRAKYGWPALCKE